MRILIDYRPALTARSGVGEYVHELARALAAHEPTAPPASARPSVTLFSSSWKDRVDPSALPGLPIVDRRVPVRLLNLAWHRLEWPPVERLAGADFDVVHSLHPLLMPARRAAQVVTVHDLDFLRHPERTRAEIRRDYPALAADHVRRADLVVVNSRFTASEVERAFAVPPDRLSVCAPGAPAWELRSPECSGEYILFLGTLEPRKNIGALLDAYATLLTSERGVPDLVLAGQATADAGPWLARLTEPPLAGRVRAVGYVQPAARRALFERAAMLVMPSFHEGFGLPVLEALTLGVPVVSSNRGALPEVVGDGGLLVEPTAEALSHAMSRVLSEPEETRARVIRGRERSQRFTWRAAAAAAFDGYARAIERRRARSHA